MATFAISGRNLPSVRSYEQAVKTWDDACQHDRFAGWRGLVNKRDTSKTLRKLGDQVIFRYHHTDLVVWEPTKLYVKCYDSNSSVIFADRFLPHGMHVTTVNGSMYVYQGGGYYQPRDRAVELNFNGKEWVVDESTCIEHIKYVLDRKRAAGIRKALGPIRDHRDMLLRLRGGSHRAEFSDEYRLCQILKNALVRGEPNQHDFLSEGTFYDDSILLKNAYLVGGAVSKVKVQAEPRPKNPYAGRAGLSFLL